MDRDRKTEGQESKDRRTEIEGQGSKDIDKKAEGWRQEVQRYER